MPCFRSVSALILTLVTNCVAAQETDVLDTIKRTAPDFLYGFDVASRAYYSTTEVAGLADELSLEPRLENQTRFQTSFDENLAQSWNAGVSGQKGPVPKAYLMSFTANPDAYAISNKKLLFEKSPVWTHRGVGCSEQFGYLLDQSAFLETANKLSGASDLSLSDLLDLHWVKAIFQSPDLKSDRLFQSELKQFKQLERTRALIRTCNIRHNLYGLEKDATQAAADEHRRQMLAMLDALTVQLKTNGQTVYYQGGTLDDGPEPRDNYWRFALGWQQGIVQDSAFPGLPMGQTTLQSIRVEGLGSEPIGDSNYWYNNGHMTIKTAHPITPEEEQRLIQERLIPNSNCTAKHDYLEMHIPGYLFGDICVAGNLKSINLKSIPTQAEIKSIGFMPQLERINFESVNFPEKIKITQIQLRTLFEALPKSIQKIGLKSVEADALITIIPEWTENLPYLKEIQLPYFRSTLKVSEDLKALVSGS